MSWELFRKRFHEYKQSDPTFSSKQTYKSSKQETNTMYNSGKSIGHQKDKKGARTNEFSGVVKHIWKNSVSPVRMVYKVDMCS